MLKVIPSGRTDRSHDDLHKVTTDDVDDDAITRLQRIICDETQPTVPKFSEMGETGLRTPPHHRTFWPALFQVGR